MNNFHSCSGFVRLFGVAGVRVSFSLSVWGGRCAGPLRSPAKNTPSLHWHLIAHIAPDEHVQSLTLLQDACVSRLIGKSGRGGWRCKRVRTRLRERGERDRR